MVKEFNPCGQHVSIKLNMASAIEERKPANSCLEDLLIYRFGIIEWWQRIAKSGRSV